MDPRIIHPPANRRYHQFIYSSIISHAYIRDGPFEHLGFLLLHRFSLAFAVMLASYRILAVVSILHVCHSTIVHCIVIPSTHLHDLLCLVHNEVYSVISWFSDFWVESPSLGVER